MTLKYYEEHADDFIKNTLSVDVSELYKPFLKHLKQQAKILDAGCGSGRDSLAFKKMGFNVTSFDASYAMAQFASKLIGNEVKCMTFQEVSDSDYFDGVWACASLLHVPKTELVSVIQILVNTLKKNGIMYMSFKYGNIERNASDGRFFLDLDENTLTSILDEVGNLLIDTMWVTDDKRIEKQNSKWLNVIVRKKN